MDATTFRADFPEFASTATYPDSLINFWLVLGGKLLSSTRWDTADIKSQGLELFVAHHVTLAKMNQEQTTAGDAPGTQTGAVASMAVDKVNISYDNNAGLEEKAGHWNLTTYGKMFIRLARMVGTGGVQL